MAEIRETLGSKGTRLYEPLNGDTGTLFRFHSTPPLSDGRGSNKQLVEVIAGRFRASISIGSLRCVGCLLKSSGLPNGASLGCAAVIGNRRSVQSGTNDPLVLSARTRVGSFTRNSRADSLQLSFARYFLFFRALPRKSRRPWRQRRSR